MCTLTLNNGVYGARFLAEATVDALLLTRLSREFVYDDKLKACLGHVNVVLGGPSRPILSGFGFDGDSLGRTNSLAEFASCRSWTSGFS